MSQYMDRKELRRTDRFTHLAVATATQALARCEAREVTGPAPRVGTAISSGLGGIATMVDQIMVMEHADPRASRRSSSR